MEPVTTAIVTALLAGGAKIAEKAVVDAYEGLKAVIIKKYGENKKVVQALENVEEEPEFEPNQATVEKRIQDANIDKDPEVAQAAERLLEELKKRPETVKATGVNLKNVEGASLRVRNIAASGTGANLEDSKFMGDLTFEDIRAGVDDSPN
jgi:predicted RND superfamily exporter protein